MNSTRLAVISDNIANSNTNGYRRSDVDFSSLVTSSQGGTFSAGGVSVSTFREVTKSAPIATTGSATDIAVSGNGLLPVTPITSVEEPSTQRPFQMTATGSFRQNENGYLVTPGGLALLGWPTDADGNLTNAIVRDSPTSLEAIRLSSYLTAAEATTRIELGVNLPAEETIAGAAGTPISSNIEYFDALGIKNQLQITYTPVVNPTGQSNAWNIQFIDNASAAPGIVADLDLTFDGTRNSPGSLLTAAPSAANPVDPQGAGTTATYDATTGALTIHVLGGPIEVQLASTPTARGMSQLASDFTPDGLAKNGAPAGSLTGLEIDSDGILAGVYDTGQRQALFQIPLASVANPNGLTALDNQAFEISQSSGDVFFFDSGSGPVGVITGFALQQSTVDIAEELTDMIVAQRAFSSNATVVRTVDEMLAETTSIKR